MPIHDPKIFYQRNLPHYQPPGAILFITFRLAGSLPRIAIQRLEAEASRQSAELGRIEDPSERKQATVLAQKTIFDQWDAELDLAEYGPRWLALAEVARLMCDALHFMDGKQYSLEAYSVMPNHVHLVCSPLCRDGTEVSLSKMMQSLKGYTAWKANRLLDRRGAFWQEESYDHVVRGDEELQRIVDYVLMNPVKAGLAAQWVYSRQAGEPEK